MKNGRNKAGKFTCGNSGRPKGARNKKILAVESLLEGQEFIARQGPPNNLSNKLILFVIEQMCIVAADNKLNVIYQIFFIIIKVIYRKMMRSPFKELFNI